MRANSDISSVASQSFDGGIRRDTAVAAFFATRAGSFDSGGLGQAECGERDEDLTRAGRGGNLRGGGNDPAAVLRQASSGVHRALHKPGVDADPHA
jgi:hypothetical protein